MIIPSAYVAAVRNLFQLHENLENAVSMKRYMKDQFEFLELKSPKG